MRDLRPFQNSTRLPASIPGIPDSLARALDRRHRLDRQMRSFVGPHRHGSAEPIAPGEPFSVTSVEGGPGPG